MSDWFTSKLKAAESILQKIDQQAAESLRKDERPQSDGLSVDTPTRTGGSVPLKDQLKKKSPDNSNHGGRLFSDFSNSTISHHESNKGIPSTSSAKPSPTPNSNVTDGDWTELLSSQNPPLASPGKRSNGLPGVVGGKNNYRRQGSFGSKSMSAELKRNQKTSNTVAKVSRRSGVLRDNKLNGKPADGENSGLSDSAGMRMASDVNSANNGKFVKQQALDQKVAKGNAMLKPAHEESMENVGQLNVPLQENVSRLIGGSGSTVLPIAAVDAASQLKVGFDRDGHGVKGTSVTSLPRDVNGTSNAGSASETTSGSTSDSESEDEREREERRKRREKILAEKAAAKAVEAIRERENMVARLEGEKQSLEKIIEERARQQVKEASELQTTMMETMEAVELEKQKHNNTRMEALTRLAKLETANADLAKSLATAQWNLEVEVKRVAELRQQIELKEVAHEELRRRISNGHQTGSSLKQLASTKALEVERELLEAECAFLADKIEKLEEKAKNIEANIEMTRKEMEEPTEVEFELKRRLGQLTDHLIQKQAQVEALSSEKATLVFRIETVSRMLDEGHSTINVDNFSSIPLKDIESGTWELFNSKTRPLLEGKIRSGREQLHLIVRQLDAIFLAGSVFLKRNPTAKIWSLIYLVCLHLWVLYIFTSHTPPTPDAQSGAVMSLENMNSSGV
ncbi:golgin candidate 2 [Rhodamnia argentea]|uniref:Golgin candidate 2 n=1 Tax=Rhodamnia argentea TaxID=178133 RepID=A0A8B8PGW8_9MYRT|nr:golgin candidate 2 [Rhodamnia argentea]